MAETNKPVNPIVDTFTDKPCYIDTKQVSKWGINSFAVTVTRAMKPLNLKPGDLVHIAIYPTNPDASGPHPTNKPTAKSDRPANAATKHTSSSIDTPSSEQDKTSGADLPNQETNRHSDRMRSIPIKRRLKQPNTEANADDYLELV